MYRISVYIKADNSFGDEIIISFHEDNIRGVAKTNSLIKNTKDRLVPVIADSYGSINRDCGIAVRTTNFMSNIVIHFHNTIVEFSSTYWTR